MGFLFSLIWVCLTFSSYSTFFTVLHRQNLLCVCCMHVSQVFQVPHSHLWTDVTTPCGPAFSPMQAALGSTPPDSSSPRKPHVPFKPPRAGRVGSGAVRGAISTDLGPGRAWPATAGPVKSSATGSEPPHLRPSRSSHSGRAGRTSTTWAWWTGTTFPWLWKARAGRVSAPRPGASRTWTNSAPRSWR